MTKKEMKIRQLVADLLQASGCSCCRNNNGWEKAQKELATLLAVPLYEDLSGFDFNQFCTEPV
jgi:hypothetical protein